MREKFVNLGFKELRVLVVVGFFFFFKNDEIKSVLAHRFVCCLACYYFITYLSCVSDPLVKISNLRLQRVIEYSWSFQEISLGSQQCRHKRKDAKNVCWRIM